MKFTSDPNKQITIMAQSSMRLATDLAIADKIVLSESLKELYDVAERIMEIELALVNKHLGNYKDIQSDSRKGDIKKAFSLAKTADDLTKLWYDLSEDEQIEFQPFYNRALKKIK